MAKCRASQDQNLAVAYYRVSTQRQGESGLGLEGQRAAVLRLADARRLTVAAEFRDIESGTLRQRAGLDAAIEYCRDHGATLVIAKLDRLARNAAFTLALRDSGIKFIAADMPDANELTIGILAVVAEAEAKAISDRTKTALAVLKADNEKLGMAFHGSDFAKVASEKGCAVIAGQARDFAASIADLIQLARENGNSTASAIARFLNRIKAPARNGGRWQAVQVQRVLARMV